MFSLLDLMTKEETESLNSIADGQNGLDFLKAALSSGWYEEEILRNAVRPFLERMALTYLTQEKRRGFVFDSVGESAVQLIESEVLRNRNFEQ